MPRYQRLFSYLQFTIPVELYPECHRISATLVSHAFVLDFFKRNGAASCCRRSISDVLQKAFKRCLLLSEFHGHFWNARCLTFVFRPLHVILVRKIRLKAEPIVPDCVSDDSMRVFSFYFDFVGERLIREKTLSSGTDTFYLDVTGFWTDLHRQVLFLAAWRQQEGWDKRDYAYPYK